MARIEKNFSWTMTVELKDGSIKKCNINNLGNGYKQSWYSTEEKARKALRTQIEWTTEFGNKVISWKVFDRNGTIEEG